MDHWEAIKTAGLPIGDFTEVVRPSSQGGRVTVFHAMHSDMLAKPGG